MSSPSPDQRRLEFRNHHSINTNSVAIRCGITTIWLTLIGIHFCLFYFDLLTIFEFACDDVLQKFPR